MFFTNIMTYQETVEWLFNQLPMFHRIGKAAYKADLANTLALDRHFNHPHRKFKSVHVAGTNGKGSCSHMLASVLQEADYKVGLYTSPHLLDFRERIKINGKPIPEQEVVDFVVSYHRIFENIKPSFFEMTVALAFDYFAREQIDIAVVEVGMGGRLDSTNIITPLLSLITNIGLDHTDFLGDSVAKIAAEKAGIIKPDVPVVVGEWEAESASVFDKKANELNAPIVYANSLLSLNKTYTNNSYQEFNLTVPSDFSFQQASYKLDLLGSYQQKNILSALTALHCLRMYSNLAISQEAVTSGLARVVENTSLMGRWQTIGTNPLCICDTGHNAHGFTLSMQQLKSMTYGKLYFVLGVMGDKDLQSILPLLPKDAYYFFTRANLPRAMDAQVLAAKCTTFGLQGEVVEPVSSALEKAKSMASEDDVVFVGGSTFVVAEVV